MNLGVEKDILVDWPLWTLAFRTGTKDTPNWKKDFITSIHADILLLCFASLLNIIVAFKKVGLVWHAGVFDW